MRGLLAENLQKASTQRTVAAITERVTSDANADVAEVASEQRPTQTAQAQGAIQAASQAASAPDPAAPTPAARAANAAASRLSAIAAATAAMPPPAAKVEQPALLTSGVIQTQPMSVIPGSSEPMKPVKVKTVQVKAGQVKLALAGAAQPAPPVTSTIPPVRADIPETSNAVVAKAAEANKSQPAKTEPKIEATMVEAARPELPPQPPGHGTGNGLLGVLAASSVPAASNSQPLAYADPSPRPQPPLQPQAIQQDGAVKPVAHAGWIVQVGALESESEAQQRIEAARSQARGLLAKADPFTEPVVAKDNRKLFRARFAGLERGQAEAVCKALRRSDISCITVHN
jgi:D-alanyl-D-alanine carboxypeptidase